MKNQEGKEIVHTLAAKRFRTLQNMAAPTLCERAGILGKH